MEKKEIEEELKKNAKRTEMKSFSVHWDKIKCEVGGKEKTEKRNRKPIFYWFSAVACCALTLAIVLPIALQNKKPIVYFDSGNLVESFTKTKEEFYEGIDSIGMKLVDIEQFSPRVYVWYQEKDTEAIRGGVVDIYDDDDAPSMLVIIKFYDQTIRLNDAQMPDCDQFYETNGISVGYQSLGGNEDEGYSYLAYSVYNDVQYMIEYWGLEDHFFEFIDLLL